jgi:Phage capsid family
LVGADTPLDAIEKAVDDIRVGPMFARADTILLHPSTLGYLKRQKTTLGSYVLSGDPKTGLVDSIWDLKIVESTKLPMNYAIVFDSTVAILGFTRQALTVEMNMWSDTAWTTNQVLWRAEERIAVAYQKPKAINIVTGFPGAGSSGSQRISGWCVNCSAPGGQLTHTFPPGAHRWAAMTGIRSSIGPELFQRTTPHPAR